MSVEVRELTEEDVEAHARVVAAIAEEETFIATPPGTSVAALAERFRRERREGALILTVVDDGRVVGGGSVRAMGARRDHVAALGMGIAREARGRGLGARLLDALLDGARERGFEKVHLTAWATNARAIRLYESRGFVVEGVLRGQARIRGALVDEVVMAKWLADPRGHGAGGGRPVRDS